MWRGAGGLHLHLVVSILEFPVCILEIGSLVSQAGLQEAAARDDFVTLMLLSSECWDYRCGITMPGLRRTSL